MAKNTGAGVRRSEVSGRRIRSMESSKSNTHGAGVGTATPKSRSVIKEMSSEHRDALKRLVDR